MVGLNVALWIWWAAAGTLLPQLLGALLLAALCAALFLHEFFFTRLILTPRELIVRDAGMRTGRLNRSEIAAVERRSFWINVIDQTSRRRLRIQPYYTSEQIKALADALGVPFIDRAKGHGLRGRLLS